MRFKKSWNMQHFISAKDVSDIDGLIQDAAHFKADPLRARTLGQGKKVGLLFFNASLRTRISTQVAAQNLGLETIVFNVDKEGWALEFLDGAIMNGNSVEHIRDAAPVLGAYFDILCVRSFPALHDRELDYSEHIINSFIKYCGIPIVSLESSTLHPLQSLADLLTITEHLPANKKPKIVLAWAPHIKPLPQCVANSFAQWVNAWGKSDFVITHPEGYTLSPEFTQQAVITHNLEDALEGADFVYVKNWSAWEDYGAMPGLHQDWMLTNEKLSLTNDARVMHCLPVRRNVELSDEVLDGPNSLVTQEASNRVWAAQAVLAKILNS